MTQVNQAQGASPRTIRGIPMSLLVENLQRCQLLLHHPEYMEYMPQQTQLAAMLKRLYQHFE